MAAKPATNVQIATEAQLLKIESINQSKARRLIKKRNEAGLLTYESFTECTGIDDDKIQEMVDKAIISFEQFATKSELKELSDKIDNIEQVTLQECASIRAEMKQNMNQINDKFDQIMQRLDVKNEDDNSSAIQELDHRMTSLENRFDNLERDNKEFKEEMRREHKKMSEELQNHLVITNMLLDEQRQDMVFKIENMQKPNEKQIQNIISEFANMVFGSKETHTASSDSDSMDGILKLRSTDKKKVKPETLRLTPSKNINLNSPEKKPINMQPVSSTPGVGNQTIFADYLEVQNFKKQKDNERREEPQTQASINNEVPTQPSLPRPNLDFEVQNQRPYADTNNPTSRYTSRQETNNRPQQNQNQRQRFDNDSRGRSRYRNGGNRSNTNRNTRNGDASNDRQSDRQNTSQRSRLNASSKNKSKRERLDSSSSMSSLSDDRDSTSDRDRSRSKSPQGPKMITFDGTGQPSWESFIFQFERVSTRRRWRNSKRIEKLFDSLKDNALEFARKVDTGEYHSLKKKLRERFSKKLQPVTARRQLQYIKQQEDESLEDFSQKVYSLTMDGYDKCELETVEAIATEAFLRGCKEKDAAIKAMEKDPTTLSKAVKLVKTSLANHRAIFGTSKQSYSQRQVTFSESEEVITTPTKPNSSLEQEIQNLSSLVGKLTNAIATNAEKREKSPSSSGFTPKPSYQGLGYTPNGQRQPVNLRPAWQSSDKQPWHSPDRKPWQNERKQFSPNRRYNNSPQNSPNRYNQSPQYRNQNKGQYSQNMNRNSPERQYRPSHNEARGFTPPKFQASNRYQQSRDFSPRAQNQRSESPNRQPLNKGTN